MSFSLDTVIAESKLEPFAFQLEGEELTLPHAQTLTAEQAVGIETGNAVQVLREIAGDELGTRLGRLPGFALNALLEEWSKHSGIKMGEEPASTRS